MSLRNISKKSKDSRRAFVVGGTTVSFIAIFLLWLSFNFWGNSESGASPENVREAGKQTAEEGKIMGEQEAPSFLIPPSSSASPTGSLNDISDIKSESAARADTLQSLLDGKKKSEPASPSPTASPTPLPTESPPEDYPTL